MIKDSQWIRTTDSGDVCPEFVKQFAAKADVKSAELVITAIGVYEAYLNGQRVGDFILAPGCTAYNKRLQYQTYDITEMIKYSNTLSVTVGKGWHRSRMSENRPEINTKPCAIIAEIVLKYENGETDIIRTDEEWTTRNSRVVFNDIWDGETYDATLEKDALKAVRVIDIDKDILIPQEGEYVREQDILYPKQLIITPKGERVIDFGQEITGYVEFSVDAKKGDRVEWTCAEVLDKDGNFYNDNYRSAKSKLTYICRDGIQSYKPCFTFYGFRYIRLDKYPGDIILKDFKAIAVYSDMERIGFVHTSNEKLNKLFSNALWSQRDNFLDIPTDCPQRDERMGWTGDAQVFAKTACYNYNTKKFFEKWLGDLRAEQREDGSVPDTVPNFWKIMRSSTAWGDVINVVAWQVYLMYGDKNTLAANFDAMKHWVDFMTNDSLDKYLWICPDDSDKLWRKHYGDWLALDAPEGSYRGITPDNFIASAFYAHSTDLLIKAGNALGKDMTEYEELYKNIVRTFKKTFNTFTTQTEHVLALAFDLTDNKAETAKSLANMIKKNGNKLQTGFVGTPYLLHALSENSYADVAYDLLLQEEYPSWLYEVNHGATTIWEHWDGIKEDGSFWSADMNSYNHYAYGSVMDWVYSVAGGIKPDERYAGFERAIIAPTPTDKIESIEVKYKSVKGEIVSKWTNTDEVVKYEITTPVPAKIIIDGVEYEKPAGNYTFAGLMNDKNKITQAEMDAVYEELKTPYKYGVVISGTADEGTTNVDCPGIFRYNNKWYMTYVSHNEASEYGGYRTNLASSDNLLEWKYEGVVFQNTANYPQCAAFPALQNTEWGGTCELEQIYGRYWWTTMEGKVKGYEGEPMNIGLLFTENPSVPAEYCRENDLLFTVDDKDVREGERGTLFKSNIIHDRDRITGYEYVMYYNAKNPRDCEWIERIYMAVSNDMRSWHRYGGSWIIYNEGFSITGDPQVVRMGDLWVMNLFVYKGGSESAYDTFAVSKDLVHWRLWNGKPTVYSSEEYDIQHAHKPWVIKHNGVVYHFYCAKPGNNTPRSIALATSAQMR